jgi:hypothetical protein
MKMSTSDMERIEQLKDKANKGYNDIEWAKVDEGKQRNVIEVLKGEIAALKRQLNATCEIEERQKLSIL